MRVDNWPLCLLCSSKDQRKVLFFCFVFFILLLLVDSKVDTKLHRVTMKCLVHVQYRLLMLFNDTTASKLLTNTHTEGSCGGSRELEEQFQ